MTDWAVQSVFFCPKTTQKLPKIERKLPKYCPETMTKSSPKNLIVSEDKRLPKHCPGVKTIRHIDDQSEL